MGCFVPGDTVEVSDPRGSFPLSLLQTASSVILLAAGTGVTPILSLLPHLRKNVKTTLIDFNKTWSDIIWRDKIDTFQRKNSW